MGFLKKQLSSNLIDVPFSVSSGIVYCNTAFLDLNTNQWTSGPNLTTCRAYHSCNLITNPLGQKEVVVVGGENRQLPNCTTIGVAGGSGVGAEIINLHTNSVRNGELHMPREYQQCCWKRKCNFLQDQVYHKA